MIIYKFQRSIGKVISCNSLLNQLKFRESLNTGRWVSNRVKLLGHLMNVSIDDSLMEEPKCSCSYCSTDVSDIEVTVSVKEESFSE